MTSRDRVLTALNHEQPDRVPIDLGGHRSSGIAAIAYAKLRRALGLAERPVRVYDPVQQLAIVDEDVLDRLRVDTIELGRGFALDDEHWADWTLPDGTPCQMPRWALPERERGAWVIRSAGGRTIAKMPDGALYFEQCHWPFLADDDLDRIPEAMAECMWCAVQSPPGPLVGGAEGGRILAEGARRLRERTDRAILGLFGGNLLEMGQFLYRNDHFLMLLAAQPSRAQEFLDGVVELHLAHLETFLAAVGDWIDVIVFGDDLGMQAGPQISPAMYREFFKPRHARMWRRAKELADVKVMLHCCGGVRELQTALRYPGLLVLIARTQDTNSDKEIDGQDSEWLFAYDVPGGKLKRVSPQGYRVEYMSLLKEVILVFMAPEDAPHGSRRTLAIYKYDPKTDRGELIKDIQ